MKWKKSHLSVKMRLSVFDALSDERIIGMRCYALAVFLYALDCRVYTFILIPLLLWTEAVWDDFKRVYAQMTKVDLNGIRCLSMASCYETPMERVPRIIHLDEDPCNVVR